MRRNRCAHIGFHNGQIDRLKKNPEISAFPKTIVVCVRIYIK